MKTHIDFAYERERHGWLLADLAIAMAGHVSVPLYPTLTPETIQQILEHSESRLIFVGKLDDFERMKGGIPAGLPIIALPLAPPIDTPERWSDIVASTEPLAGEPTRDPDDLATIIYTSGSTGVPKGVMHSFRTMSAAMAVGEVLELGPGDPSDLPVHSLRSVPRRSRRVWDPFARRKDRGRPRNGHLQVKWTVTSWVDES